MKEKNISVSMLPTTKLLTISKIKLINLAISRYISSGSQHMIILKLLRFLNMNKHGELSVKNRNLKDINFSIVALVPIKITLNKLFKMC